MNSCLSRLLLLLTLPLVFVACDDDDELPPLPDDGDPIVVRTLPVDSTIVVSPLEEVRIDYTLADNEQLASWQLRLRTYPFADEDLVGQDTILLSENLSGTQVGKNFFFTVPDTFAAGTITNLVFTATVQDNQEQGDTLDFVVQVFTETADTCMPPNQYGMLNYTTSDTLFAPQSSMSMASFNLLQRTYASNQAAADVRVVDTAANSFRPQFISPNNENESVLIVYKPNILNYQQLNWCKLHQAFITNTPMMETPELEEGDIVVLRMDVIDQLTPGKPHYAAIRIVDIVDNIGDDNDYILFQYKRTENN